MRQLSIIILYATLANAIPDGSTKRAAVEKLTSSKNLLQNPGRVRTHFVPPPFNFPPSRQSPPHSDTKCEIIPEHFGLCYGMEYTRMRLPNLLGHVTMNEVLQQSSSWPPLVSKGCNPETRKFLCSLFAPVCMKGIETSIPPCRSLCEAVRDDCSRTMRKFGFSWPEILNCTQFPQEHAGMLCIPEDMSDLPTIPPKVCQPCRQKQALQLLKNKFCSFDFVMKVRVKRLSYDNEETRMVIRTKKTIRWENTRPRIRKNALWMRDGLHCTCSVISNNKKSYLVTGWKIDQKLVVHSIMKWNRRNKRVIKRLKRRKC
uniref:Secreted frizzled-related protein 1 n=1 Tax=Ciona savignyi TaxID=51511 RepID=H2ZBZ4_CIOSA